MIFRVPLSVIKMSAENHTVPPVTTTVTSVDVKSSSLKTLSNTTSTSVTSSATTLTVNPSSATMQTPINDASIKPSAKPPAPLIDSSTITPVKSITSSVVAPEKKTVTPEVNSVPLTKSEGNDQTKNTDSNIDKIVMTNKTEGNVSKVSESTKTNSVSTKQPSVANIETTTPKAVDPLNTLKPEDKPPACVDKNVAPKSQSENSSSTKELPNKGAVSNIGGDKDIKSTGNDALPTSMPKAGDVPNRTNPDSKGSELNSKPVLPSGSSLKTDVKISENIKTPSSDAKVASSVLTKQSEMIPEKIVSKAIISTAKDISNKHTEDITPKTSTSNLQPPISTPTVRDQCIEKSISKSAASPVNEKKISSIDKKVDNTTEPQTKTTNTAATPTTKVAEENKKPSAPVVFPGCSGDKSGSPIQSKSIPTTNVANTSIPHTPTTKAPSSLNEKATTNVDKLQQVAVAPSSNAKQISQVSKSESLTFPPPVAQSSTKQSFPITKPTSAPPITQALQASVPATTKSLDPKSNGGSQGNSRDSISATSAAMPTTNINASYPSSDTQKKTISPPSSKPYVGPPRPTTANVAPVIPPKVAKPLQSEASVSDSSYNQKATHDVQSSRTNPISAESHGAYQWPMHAMAAAAGSAGSGSAYNNSAGSYGNSNMPGAYGSGGTFGGSSAATAHAENPFMSPLMTQMRQSNPQAAAMLAFAAAASAAQQQMTQRQQQQQQQLQHHQQQLHHQQQQHYQQHHHQQQAHHQQPHHQQHSHHQQQQHHSQQHTQQQPPPAHHSHQQQRHQPWPSSAYGSPTHPTPPSHNKTNQQVAHATSHHSLSGIAKPPHSNQMPKHVPTSNLTPLKPPHVPTSSNAMASKHSQFTASTTPPKAAESQHTPVIPSKSQSLSSPKEVSPPYKHMMPAPTSKVLPFPKQTQGGSSGNSTPSKSSVQTTNATKSEKLPDAKGMSTSKLMTVSSPTSTQKSSPSSASGKLPTPPASQPVKAVLPPKQTEHAIKPEVNKDVKQEFSPKKKTDAKSDEKDNSTVREAPKFSSDTKIKPTLEQKPVSRHPVHETPNKDKKNETKAEVKPTAIGFNAKASKASSSEHEKIVPPLKLHKMIAATSPPLSEEKVPPLKISTKGAQDQRTVAPLKLGKLPQLKSPKPAEKKPRKRPLSKVQAPPPPV